MEAAIEETIDIHPHPDEKIPLFTGSHHPNVTITITTTSEIMTATHVVIVTTATMQADCKTISDDHTSMTIIPLEILNGHPLFEIHSEKSHHYDEMIFNQIFQTALIIIHRMTTDIVTIPKVTLRIRNLKIMNLNHEVTNPNKNHEMTDTKSTIRQCPLEIQDSDNKLFLILDLIPLLGGD